MAHPSVTVVVSVYNMGPRLPKAIDCLLEQTCPDFELLIVDDGSTDGSGAVCDGQGSRDPRIRVIHKENGGLSSARNCGIDHANGDFIIFPDPDDWVEPDYLANLIAQHEANGTDLEICGHFVTYDDSERQHNPNAAAQILDREAALELLMKPTAFCGFASTKLYHLDLIRENALRFDTELGMAQDLHFAYRYFCLCERISYDPKPLYHYYQAGGGVTSTNQLTPRKLSGLKTYEKIAELAHEDHPSVERAACGTLFNMSMHDIYLYYDSKMRDQKTLDLLKHNLKTYRSAFFSSDVYSAAHKALGRLALLSPRLYYLTKRCLS